MTNNAEDPKNDINNGNDGFVWSQRLTLITGTVIAIALAAAHFVPILAGPIGWNP
jgi:hypothetical protein